MTSIPTITNVLEVDFWTKFHALGFHAFQCSDSSNALPTRVVLGLHCLDCIPSFTDLPALVNFFRRSAKAFLTKFTLDWVIQANWNSIRWDLLRISTLEHLEELLQAIFDPDTPQQAALD